MKKYIKNDFLGSTRDMGACLTRICIRQRSVENRLRGLADSLTDELALSIQNKTSYWKQRAVEMDRHASKFCRKVELLCYSFMFFYAIPERIVLFKINFMLLNLK